MTAPASKPPSNLARFAPLGLILMALGLFFGLGLHRYVTIETLAENRTAFSAFVAENLLAAIAIYMTVYAVLVAISFPGAGLLTIFGGFLFGLWGAIPTVLAATLGAVGVFLAAKTALGEGLKERAGGFIARFEEGFRSGEFSYLLILRLVPAFPFWIVNVAPAFLGANLGKYFLATLIGIIPGTFVYTSIGAGAGALFDAGETPTLAGVMTKPEILLPIGGLIVLSIIPVVVRAVRKDAALKA